MIVPAAAIRETQKHCMRRADMNPAVQMEEKMAKLEMKWSSSVRAHQLLCCTHQNVPEQIPLPDTDLMTRWECVPMVNEKMHCGALRMNEPTGGQIHRTPFAEQCHMPLAEHKKTPAALQTLQNRGTIAIGTNMYSCNRKGSTILRPCSVQVKTRSRTVRQHNQSTRKLIGNKDGGFLRQTTLLHGRHTHAHIESNKSKTRRACPLRPKSLVLAVACR
jgi:hypothetical protein